MGGSLSGIPQSMHVSARMGNRPWPEEDASMTSEVSWKVGGKQGEGIDSTGEIYAISLHRMGYYVFTYRHFMSLIKGGHTNYKIRSADRAIQHHGDDVHVLIAFDQTTVDYNWREMVDGGVVVYDSSIFTATRPDDRDVHLCGVPLTELAKEAGNAIMKNLVAIGVSAAIHHLDPHDFAPVVEEKFGKKGHEVVAQNMNALQQGYQYFQEHFSIHIPFPAKPEPTSADHLYVSGNQAVGFGALAGGCRVLAAYPITPATEIMYWLIEHLPKHDGVVVQAEDEIAAINMAIGANFAGARAMTSTSGPGFSLMMEALGLAGMSETPVVIVDVQRGGPSTGLPTKTEQSDLNEAVYGTHGDIQRIVLTPRTVEECFLYTADAFNLADHYQCPVIVLTDLYIGMSYQSIDGFPVKRVVLDRGKLAQDGELANLGPYEFQRYSTDVEDGISPRSFPGQKNGRYVALGNEHNGIGMEVEDLETRIVQVAKRNRKLENFQHESGVTVDGDSNAAYALISFGSTWGLLEEAREHLQAEGFSVKHIQFSRVAPFPTDPFHDAMDGVRKAIVVEHNISGQLAQMIRQHAGYHDLLHSCLKYDGDPVSLKEVLQSAKQTFPVEVLN
jgi:2-oxoglutarate/2-oxoacid ferredoxin oxidoreductase subunit alpha